VPYRAPWIPWVGGDGGDSNAGTREFAVPVQIGDFITVSATTSDYLRVWNSIYGGAVPTWYAGVFLNNVSTWGCAGIWGGWPNQNGTFNVGMTFSGGNNGANYEQMRIIVWRGGVDGWGAQGYERKYNNSDVFLTVNNRGGQTACHWCAVDWNAAGVVGTTQQQGGPGHLDAFFAGGAARYWAGNNNPLASPGGYWVGNYGTGNSKVSTVAQEVLGAWYDDTAPTVPTGVTAVANTQSSVTVSWTASTDPDPVAGSGVASYRIRKNGVDLAGATALTGLTYTDTAAKLTDYYTVSAVDRNGNRSGESAIATIPAPAFKMGADAVTNLKLGSSNVDRLYLGSTRVFP
jgi:uncharacterized protein YbjQ (UPF0145 family)